MNAFEKGLYEAFLVPATGSNEVLQAIEHHQDDAFEKAQTQSEVIIRRLLQFRQDAGLPTIEQIDASNQFAEQQRVYDDLADRMSHGQGWR